MPFESITNFIFTAEIPPLSKLSQRHQPTPDTDAEAHVDKDSFPFKLLLGDGHTLANRQEPLLLVQDDDALAFLAA